MAPRGKKKKKSPGSILLSRNRGVQRKFDVPGTNTSSMSSKAGRTLIRSHHTLQKQLAQAKARNDLESAEALQKEIYSSGGLEKYQQASVLGQSAQRGGDSSRILMDWIRETQISPKESTAEKRLRLLEIGCLSPDNAISKSSLFDIARIDLNSRHPSIKSQDFMKRPLPKTPKDKFDIISLSLVLNYVPDPVGRGEMLKRTTQFLHDKVVMEKMDPQDPLTQLFPSLFLVLPAPCITNSRYLDESRLEEVMWSIGYTSVKRKISSKLIYSLWRLREGAEVAMQTKKFKKIEVNPGKVRNNFAVVLN